MDETSKAPSESGSTEAGTATGHQSPPSRWQANTLRRRFWVGLITVVLSPLILLSRFLPKVAFGVVGAPLAFIYRTIVRRDVRLVRENLKEILGLEPGSKEAQTLERAVFRHQVLSTIDTVAAVYRPSRLKLTGYEELAEEIRKAEEAGRGHLIVTGHLGSWELVGAACARAATRPFYALAKKSKVPAATEILGGLREQTGSKVMWIGSRTLLREMLRALKRAESLGFVMDQKPAGRRGPVVEFFSRPTEFVKGPATLSRRTGCAVIAVFGIRKGPLDYQLESQTLLESGHDQRDEIAMTQLFAHTIEEAVRRHPSQWSWNYRRWYFDEEPPPLSALQESGAEAKMNHFRKARP